MSIISFGGINKSLLYITLAGVFKVLNQYTYGFIYIGCLYFLWNIVQKKKKLDELVYNFELSWYNNIYQKNNKNEYENEKRKESKLELNLIHEDSYNYFETQNFKFVILKIIILWVLEENLLLIFVDIFQDLEN